MKYTMYDVTLSQAWYLANKFDKLTPNERRGALLNVAYGWAKSMGYNGLSIPEKISPQNFRQFFLDCITDMNFDVALPERVAA